MPKTGPNAIRVVVERGTKRVFASAVDWPGWARSGRDEPAALDALFAYGPRYAAVVGRTKLGFAPPADVASFYVIERVKGNTTTDFGAPGVPGKIDSTEVDADELARLRTLLH